MRYLDSLSDRPPSLLFSFSLRRLTVSQCLSGVPAYKLQGKRQERDETWTCDGQISYVAKRQLASQRRMLKRAVEESLLGQGLEERGIDC